MVVLGVTDIGDEKYVYPVARLVIDNEDLLADANKRGYKPGLRRRCTEVLTDGALDETPPCRVEARAFCTESRTILIVP